MAENSVIVVVRCFMVYLVYMLAHSEATNMTRLQFHCQQWDREYPTENNVTKRCFMKVKENYTKHFLSKLKNSNFDLELFRFYLKFDTQETFQTKCAVEPRAWTWTYPAPLGAYQFLKWPKEYVIWSLGLLDMYSYGPLNLHMEVYGNCPVIIGQKATAQRIGLALLEMTSKTLEIPNANIDLGYGSVCYTERNYIGNDYLYALCLHIICPKKALGYKCCTSEMYENTTRVVCDGNMIYFDEAWWAIPFTIGLLLFAFSPFILVKVFHHSANTEKRDCKFEIDEHIKNGDWLLCNPLSFFSILKDSLAAKFAKERTTLRILRRICIAILTVVVILIQVAVHYLYDYNYTVLLVKHGVPIAFRSMVAGYTNSKKNFMPIIGGPFVGLGIYLITTIILVTIPRDLEALITNGIPDYAGLARSPLTIDIRTKGKFGAVYNIERKKGYNKLYNIMKSHIFMLINPSFWKLAIQMQVRRIRGFIDRSNPNLVMYILIVAAVAIPYIFLCVLELFLSVLYFGFPVGLFFQVIVRAYYAGIKSKFGRFGIAGKLAKYMFTFVIVLNLTFNIYILTVVFVDSFHFITRIMIFTFTGFIAYPSTTYGYSVFIITVLMYVTESIQQIRSTYCKLFMYVLRHCDSIRNDKLLPQVDVAKKVDGVLIIPRELFLFIVSHHKPIRVEIFFSILKLFFITFLLYLASYTIVSLQKLRDLTPLTQVVTALFVCLMPKIWRMLFVNDEYLEEIHENEAVKKLVVSYCRQKPLNVVELRSARYDGFESNDNRKERRYGHKTKTCDCKTEHCDSCYRQRGGCSSYYQCSESTNEEILIQEGFEPDFE